MYGWTEWKLSGMRLATRFPIYYCKVRTRFIDRIEREKSGKKEEYILERRNFYSYSKKGKGVVIMYLF